MTDTVVLDDDAIEASTPFLSHSRIAKYLMCPEQYRLHYVGNLRPRVPSASLAFGQVLHQALAHLFKIGEDPGPAFSKLWATLREIDLAYSRKDTWEKLHALGVAILARFVAEAVPRISNVTGVEKRFELQVTSLTLPMVGVVDLVANLDGMKTVIDFKTATSPYDDHEVVLSDQLTCYRLAEPDALQVGLCVLTKTKEPKVVWQLTARTPDQVEAYLDKVAHVATAIASGAFYRRAGMWCSWCDFLPVCVGNKKRVEDTLIRIR